MSTGCEEGTLSAGACIGIPPVTCGAGPLRSPASQCSPRTSRRSTVRPPEPGVRLARSAGLACGETSSLHRIARRPESQHVAALAQILIRKSRPRQTIPDKEAVYGRALQASLADLANADANSGSGLVRMSLEQLVVGRQCKLVNPAVVDDAGRPKSCYGSEGWGSSPSERAQLTGPSRS